MADIMPPAAPSAQPPTPLLATRDTLVAWFHDTECATTDHAGEWRHCEARTDAFLASGVVRDPATLMDDEALVERVAQLTRSNDLACDAQAVRDVLRALAAALTEDPS